MKKAWHIFEEQLNSCSTKAGMLCLHKNTPTLSVCQSELVLEKQIIMSKFEAINVRYLEKKHKSMSLNIQRQETFHTVKNNNLKRSFVNWWLFANGIFQLWLKILQFIFFSRTISGCFYEDIQ